MIYRDKNGFTLVELMIAVTVFSVLLILSAASLTQISRLYYKAVIVTKTQNVNRNIMDNIAQAFQFSSGNVATGGPSSNGLKSICVGNIRYTYVLNKQINSVNKHGLWRDKIASSGSCTPLNFYDDSELENSISSAEGVELLEPGIRLKAISVTPSAVTEIKNVDVAVIYGDDDLIDFSDSANTQPVGCKGGVTGSQWCALSRLYTQVFSRVKS
ncbi:MAG TPA: prepilin-type N-terminal cleavage/methylation domain-containing protein [Candidatus Saccharibacteria bacterium]|nr:prepilin-type N-terminal cleavage/methylation domain-containing protein [Candidatus Saccharibacteria bacterium]